MTIRIGEIGKLIYVNTTFDMSGNTGLEINFTSPDGLIKFTRTNPDVTAPNVDSPSIPGIGILPANTYMVYPTQENDFEQEGNWCLQAVYIDDTPKRFIGTEGLITIEGNC